MRETQDNRAQRKVVIVQREGTALEPSVGAILVIAQPLKSRRRANTRFAPTMAISSRSCVRLAASTIVEGLIHRPTERLRKLILDHIAKECYLQKMWLGESFSVAFVIPIVHNKISMAVLNWCRLQ